MVILRKNLAGAEEPGLPGPVLGMALFVASETMFFAALFAAYFSLRDRAGAWPPAGIEVEPLIPAIASLFLFASSATVHRAMRATDAATTRRWLLITLGLGLAFLGAQAYEYANSAFSLDSGTYGAGFFTLTGFHGLHVAIGVAMLALAAAQTRRLGLAHRSRAQLEATAFYWHFVDVVWVAVFTIVYLVR